MMSQIDVAPTVLGLLGVEYLSRFVGADALAPSYRPRAFISNYQALGYLRHDTLTVLLPKGKVEAYAVDPATKATTPTTVNEPLKQEAIAYYQTAYRAFKAGALVPHMH